MAKDKTNENEKLLTEVQDSLESSDKNLETIRADWDELEAMLIARLTDSLSPTTSNRIFDPVLSTIVYERVSRVMAQNPKGKAYAQSTDDVGKNALMNLLLSHYYKNANEQETMLIKLRLWDLYSLVYGSMFALVPWRINDKGYIGPELNILPIRDCYPQMNKSNVEDMDWFIVRNVVTIDWLLKQDPDVWDMESIEKLQEEMETGESGGDEAEDSIDDERSYVEETFYPGSYADVSYPQVEMFTRYEKSGRWISWTPKRINAKTSRPHILRVAEDAYVENTLPIVAKHAFPLIDSPIGFGEFARGKSLQMGINSLWNLYMQGVKYSIFPPLHINPDNVVASSIKWGEGEFWFMENPNQDIQPMNIKPSGIETFNSTFGALKAAIESQAGTTSTRESAHTESGLGKTPQAINFIAQREGARDEWDRVMMEQSIDQMYDRWIGLTVKNMNKEQHIRLFGDEIEDIQQTYPDVVELYDSGKQGSAKIKKNMINATYDFVLETGSTVKPNLEEEQNNLTAVLKAVLENPPILEALQAEGKTINLPLLFKKWVQAGGIKDHDKIITDIKQEEPEAEEGMPQEQMPQEQMMPGQPMPQQMPQQPQRPQINPQDFQDPDIQRAVMEMMGGVPQQNYGR